MDLLGKSKQEAYDEEMRPLLPLLENPRIRAVCEYAQATERAEWTLRYAGPRLDLSRTHDDLALSVLKGMTESLEYSWQEADPLPNWLTVAVKSIE